MQESDVVPEMRSELDVAFVSRFELQPCLYLKLSKQGFGQLRKL